MATIGAAVSEQMKEQFVAMARARKWTPSHLALELITRFIAGQLTIDQPPATASSSSLIPPATSQPVREAKTAKVYVRLEPYYYEELGRLASERGWHRGTHLAEMFYAHCHGKPRFCDAEINALRQVARQLADMGRNINQIARKLNSSLEEAHNAQAVDFELVKMLIDLETNAVKDLIRANVRGWGVTVDADEHSPGDTDGNG